MDTQNVCSIFRIGDIDVVRLHVQWLDSVSVPIVLQILDNLCHSTDARGIVLNLSFARIGGASGLIILVRLFQWTRDRKKLLAVCQAQPSSKFLMHFEGLDSVIVVKDTEAEALAVMASPATTQES